MNWYDICFFPFKWGMSCIRQNLKMILRSLKMDLSNNLSMWILIISSPYALFRSSLLMMFLIPYIENSTSESDFSVIKGKSDGNVLPLSINEHCFAKKELKISLFSLTSMINLLSWKSGVIHGIFLPFKRVFNKVQLYLGLVDGSDNFLGFSFSTQFEKSWLNLVV